MREIVTLEFGPTLVTCVEDVIDRIDKIVGISNDHSLLARGASETQAQIGNEVAVARSQPYYLDTCPCHAALEFQQRQQA